MCSTSSKAFFRSNSVMIMWRCLFLACLMIWVSSSVMFYFPWYCSPETFLHVRLSKLFLEKKVINSISNKRWIYFCKNWLKCYWTLEPFLWIKIVNACFQQLRNFGSLQQCDIILYIKVLNIEHLFKIIMLIWSSGQGDPLDSSLLIIPVISLYIGGFKSNTFKGSYSFFV